jgi:hypothetical protein
MINKNNTRPQNQHSGRFSKKMKKKTHLEKENKHSLESMGIIKSQEKSRQIIRE